MRQVERVRFACVFVVLVVLCGVTEGGVIEFNDKDRWIAAVGTFTTIGFDGFEPSTIITDQFANLGILFTDGDDRIKPFDEITFPNDGWGLDGNGNITLVFDTPQAWIAADFPGRLQIQLFANGELFFMSGILGVGGFGNFGGLVSSEPFDTAVLMDFPADFEAEIDDLHFGVPAPGVLWMLTVAMLYATPRARPTGR